ncbi:MAG TPA: hypothetical protein VFJ02_21980 [Vicinamibacterales bacterium]|nr:hypothetical protein [Vicinamibacterales bacterium]
MPTTRAALIAWAAAAIAGTIAVVWLRGYLQDLVALAQTDRETALQLFRSRALPALIGVVAIAVAAGAVLMRQGLGLVNAAPGDGGHDGGRGARPEAGARTIGWMMAGAGFIVAAVPLALLSVVFWLLQRS